MSKNRFYDSRLSYLSFVQNTNEKKIISKKVYPYIEKLPKKKVTRFLDAGIGDGTITSNIIKKFHESKRSVPTFSVVNKNPKYDERKYINQVINKYKNEHFIQEVDTQTSFEDLLNNISMFDEPYIQTLNITDNIYYLL